MATPITTFSVRITTGKAGGAGTDGNVYIGMCGREFRIDSAIDDFERNTDNTYIFGAGSNVNNSFTNDPRSLYPVSVEDIEPFPAYIRFEPDGDKDNWQLESVTVIVNNGRRGT